MNTWINAAESTYPVLERKRVVLIAKHFGENSGGEAIKAYQFAVYLKEHGVLPIIVTHERAVNNQGGSRIGLETLVVPDTALQRFSWRWSPLRGLLDIHFHLVARRLIRAHISPRNTILHYIGPVSPVQPRFFPKGYDIVLGPLTGNIFYPPAFRHRMSRRSRISEHLHGIAQRVLGLVLREKQRARVILVSGYSRTRASLRLGGAREKQMVDVVDSGVSEHIRHRKRISHSGANPRFFCSGRMDDHKGIDLAIRAVARADPAIKLDIYGDGVKRAELHALTEAEGVTDRVRFVGWVPSHDDLLDAMAQYRGFVFPTLAEANGIAMQEAMMLGVPVIAARWGGPEQLADNGAAWYVDPVSDRAMVSGLAEAMTRLAQDSEMAESISRNARRIAEERFSWDAVSRSWITAAYGTEFLNSMMAPLDTRGRSA